MGVDLSKLSNAELEAILSEGRKTAPKKLIKDMSDEELEAIAFGGGNVAPENKDQELTLGRAAGLATRGGARGVVSAGGALAGAAALAPLGAFTGPFAPVAVPALGLVGAIGGGLGLDYLAGDYVDKGMDFLGAPRAQNKTERAIQGVANAATSIASPMGIVKGGAKFLPSLTNKIIPKAVQTATTAEPGMQMLSGVAGAAVSESTDNPVLGLLAGLSPAVIKKFGAGYFKDPKDIATKLWQSALAIKDADGKVIGYHPPDSDVGLQLRKQLEGPNGEKHLQSLLAQNLDDLSSKVPADASITAPVVVGQQQQAARIAASQAQADATNAANQLAVDTAATTAKSNLAKQVGQPTQRTAVSSQAARKAIDNLESEVNKTESKLWKPITDSKLTVSIFDAKGPVKGGVLAEVEGLKNNLTQVDYDVVKPLVNKLDEIVEKFGGNVPFSEIKSLNSLAMREMRNENYGTNERRLLKDFVSRLNKGLDKSVEESSLGKAFKDQYRSAQAFTREKFDKFGDLYLSRSLDDEKIGGAPSEFIGNIVAGKANEEKVAALKNLLSPMSHPDAKGLKNQFRAAGVNVTKAVDDYITEDMIKNLGVDGVADDKKVSEFISKYASVFENSPSLKAKYENIKNAQNAAYKAVQTTAQKVDAQQIAEVSPFFKEGLDATSPAKVQTAFKEALDSTDATSISNILNEIPTANVDARQGLKRVALNHILDSKESLDELLDPNSLKGSKLSQIFDTPEEQQLLQKISESSRLLDRYNKVDKVEQEEIKRLLSQYGFLPALLGKARAFTTYGVAGGGLGVAAPAVLGALGIPTSLVTTGLVAGGVNALGGWGQAARKAMSVLGGAKRDKVVNILKEALVDPTKARELYTPQSSTAANFIIPMLSGSRGALVPREDEKSNVQKYAAGGPVYTHPAISSIRVKRAVGRMAS
jgi:hypothetical protein